MKHAVRGSIDFPLVGVAVSLSLNGNAIKDIKIAVGAATPAPIRAVKAEDALRGKDPTDDLLAQAGKLATNDVIPIVHIFAPVGQKRRMVEVLVQRGVRQAIEANR